MPDIKLRDGSGVEQTYTGVDTITVPLADGSGNFTYGLTDEELTFEDFLYLIVKRNQKIFEPVMNRIKFIPQVDSKKKKYYGLYQFTKRLTLNNLDQLVIDCSGVSCIYSRYGFDEFQGSKLPKLINANNLGIGNQAFLTNHCNNINEQEVLKYLNNFTYQSNKSDNNSTSGNQACTFFTGTLNSFLDPSDCLKKWHEIINNEQSYTKYTSSPSYDTGSSFQYVKSIRNIPVPYKVLNGFSDVRITGYGAPAYYCTDSFAFATDNGKPYKLNWNKTTLNITNYLGYDTSTNSNALSYAQGFWKEKNNVCLNARDIESAKKNYDKLKNNDNWCSFSSEQVQYNNKQEYLSKLFSRYNHDSAVETLNSLPDTSEYLATAGGTNTIKFKGIIGALTDGGAINTLTEEEIAVAVAKGWTVTFV